MSSYEKSPSCANRSPMSLMCSVTCSWAASSSSINGRTLGSCTHDYGTTVCNPNCGQRVADDYARVPRSSVFFFFAAFAPRLRNHQRAVRPWCFAVWCRALFHRRLWPKARLACGARRLIVIDRSCANSPVCCRLTTPRSAPPLSKMASSICGGSCRKHVDTHCTRCR